MGIFKVLVNEGIFVISYVISISNKHSWLTSFESKKKLKKKKRSVLVEVDILFA